MDRWPKLSFETSSGQVGHEFAGSAGDFLQFGGQIRAWKPPGSRRNVPAKQIWGAAKPRMRETAYKCGNTRDFGRLTYLWASWGWCKNFCSDLSSDSRELRRAQFAANLYVAYDSDDLGPRPAIGHLIEFDQFREVGIENVPMWRGCEGDPCCAVTRGRDGHLVDKLPARPFFLVGVVKSCVDPLNH